MSDATEQFFEELGQRGYEPLVAKFSGRVRFEVVGWTTHSIAGSSQIDKGDLAVSRDGGERRLHDPGRQGVVRPIGER